MQPNEISNEVLDDLLGVVVKNEQILKLKSCMSDLIGETQKQVQRINDDHVNLEELTVVWWCRLSR